jgi:hypothetical protein
MSLDESEAIAMPEPEEEVSHPTYSIFEVMSTHELHDDGTVTLPLLLIEGEAKKFSSKDEYDTWVQDRKTVILERTRSKLSPHELYITQGKGMERPFTGDFWWLKDVGTYSCKVCTQKLFLTEHKFNNANNGYPNFWNHIIESVDYKTDSLETHSVGSDQAYIEKKFREKVPETRAV